MEAYRNTSLPFAQRAADLVSRMTLEEKIGQLSFDAEAIPRLGVRAWTWWNEASHGVIPVFSVFSEATSFPVCLALANSWDPKLVGEVATAISDEMRAIYNATGKELDYWCPTVNMGRDPRWGRNDEAFGEDPLLAGKVAAAYVRGIQAPEGGYIKAISTPKHFAVNNSEYNRNSASSNVDEATLREYYLPVFERCIREGGAGSVMTAYNRISGIPCSANEHLLQDILYDEWGFDGYIVSDDGAVGDVGPNYNLMWGQPRGHFYGETMAEACALSLNAGTDICVGNDYRAWLKTALEQGLTDEDSMDRALVRCFTARFALGEFDAPEQLPWHKLSADDVCSEKHAEIAQRAAEDSFVLMRNVGDLLPLKTEKGKKLLVIGPNAIYRQMGSYSIGGFADTRVSVPPLQGIRNLGEQLGFSVDYAKGWHLSDGRVEGDGADKHPVLLRAAKEAGMELDEYLDARTPAHVKEILRKRAETLAGVFSREMPAPRHPVTDPDLGRADDELWAEALKKAADADAVIVIAGTDPSVTSEGRDRADLLLPYEQNEKILELLKVNPNTAAVVISVGPVCGSFLTETPAVVWAPYPGESQGTALAKMLFGLVNPSGRSSETWYPDTNCLPHISDYGLKPLDTPEQLGRTYLYWLGKPLFPFGHGLSYTQFSYENFRFEKDSYTAGEPLRAFVTVRNTGSMAGKEVVQLYFTKKEMWDNRAYVKLAAFAKVELQPGESREIELEVSPLELRYWKYAWNRYNISEGEYSFHLGRSCSEDDVITSTNVCISGRWDAALTALTLRCDKRVMLPGETAALSCTASLEDASRFIPENALLSSSDESVAIVRDGAVTAIAAGTCTITAVYEKNGIRRESSLPILVKK
ncbi:MAG: glycoside hydrolase family 3 C-terminal domain-containing protein [Oscillospiraceae bacterium]|nr:glycoside hydrolase family 3 C-terminal domain-containing protein [Oscillospiraceae bacterium]